MIFIVCQRVILIYFSAKTEMVARLRGHDRFFCHVQRNDINIFVGYGRELTRKSHSKQARVKGQAIQNLVDSLSQPSSKVGQNQDVSIWLTFNEDVRKALNQSKKDLRRNSSNLKPVLAIIISIFAALTVLGAIIILWKLNQAKKEDGDLSINSICFFASNQWISKIIV